MRRSVIAAAAGLVAAGSLALNTSVASAQANPPGCYPGNFCVYAGANQTGSLTLHTGGNWQGQVSAGSVFNNGVYYPGADHVRFTYRPFSSTRTSSSCLAYNGSGHTYKMNLPEDYVVTKVVWQRSCP